MQSKNLNKFFYFFIYFFSIISFTEAIHSKNLGYCSQIILESPAGGKEQGRDDSNPTSELGENRNTSQYAPVIEFLKENAVFIPLELFFAIKLHILLRKHQDYNFKFQAKYIADLLFLYIFLQTAKDIHNKHIVLLLETQEEQETAKNVVSELFFIIKSFFLFGTYYSIYGSHGDTILSDIAQGLAFFAVLRSAKFLIENGSIPRFEEYFSNLYSYLNLPTHYLSENYEYFCYKSLPYIISSIVIYLLLNNYNTLLLQI